MKKFIIKCWIIPQTINCQDLINMADEISCLLGCQYDSLGYMLLHPDYDYKDLGTMMVNNSTNRKQFMQLSIPLKYYGSKEEMPSSPFIIFELKAKNDMKLPLYSIQLQYPSDDLQYLGIQIDICESLLLKELKLKDFLKMHDIVGGKGYVINSAYMHYHYGNTRRMNLDGGECGITTLYDWRIIDHSIRFQQEWKNKVMDIFYMNSFNKEIISNEAMDRIVKIVGNKNIIEHEEKIIFKLPQSKLSYLLNRIRPMKSRRDIKQILQEENVCFKDASIIASILKL